MTGRVRGRQWDTETRTQLDCDSNRLGLKYKLTSMDWDLDFSSESFKPWWWNSYGLGQGRSTWTWTIDSDTDGLGLTILAIIDLIQWPEMTRFDNRKWSNDVWSGVLIHTVCTIFHKVSNLSENFESDFGVWVALVLWISEYYEKSIFQHLNIWASAKFKNGNGRWTWMI